MKTLLTVISTRQLRGEILRWHDTGFLPAVEMTDWLAFANLADCHFDEAVARRNLALAWNRISPCGRNDRLAHYFTGASIVMVGSYSITCVLTDFMPIASPATSCLIGRLSDVRIHSLTALFISIFMVLLLFMSML